jgi:trimethylamine--corrinoid protein Co-methyltransferase
LIKHGLGWLEGGLSASFEKMILDAEMLQMMVQFLEPVPINEAELGIEAINEVGPGGHFFGSAHTMERYENAFYQPLVSDWQNFENWQDSGSQTAAVRANGIYKQLLADYEEPPMDAAVRAELDDFVDRRIAAGGADQEA